MRPEKVAQCERQTEADHNIKLMEIVSQMLPLLSHFHTDIGQKKAPRQRTEKRVEYEPINIYSGNTGWQGDKCPDDRKHSAEKYGCIAILRKPSICELDVLS